MHAPVAESVREREHDSTGCLSRQSRKVQNAQKRQWLIKSKSNGATSHRRRRTEHDSLWIGSGRAVFGKKRFALLAGCRRWPPARSSASGSVTIRGDGLSFASAISLNWRTILKLAHLSSMPQQEATSPCYSAPMIRNTTMQWLLKSFCKVE